ncbi:hypothetical protein [Saccharopolyspora thermophila]|uniref:hypothetical protein n=1 Tax=Saccharopolyspora thermophila TaxID=89367 RepID=UPI001664F23F|nr:hypothetical protein [Saccharopolyspora subtropica]
MERWRDVVAHHVRVMNDLYVRYLLAWPPEPEPLQWVRRGDTWLLVGEILPDRPRSAQS